MKKHFFAVLVLFVSFSAKAEIPYGFCSVLSEGETLCTPVFPIPDQSMLNLVCDNFARALDADGFDSFLNADLMALNEKHKEVCEKP